MRPIPLRVARRVEAGVVVVLLASGLLSPSPGSFYVAAALMASILVGAFTLGALLVDRASVSLGDPIQPGGRGHDKAFDAWKQSATGLTVGGIMAAWPVSLVWAGVPTGFTWSIEQASGGSWALMIGQFTLGVVLVDAWTYWKHRLLHWRPLFAFHAAHHGYRDPTAYAAFAIGPVEALLTFWPLWIACIPAASHYLPVYYGLVSGFVLLNLYLHAGVTFGWAEWFVPRTGLNSSAWHNIHHQRVDANFGEVSYLWDRLMGTGVTPDAWDDDGPARQTEARSEDLAA